MPRKFHAPGSSTFMCPTLLRVCGKRPKTHTCSFAFSKPCWVSTCGRRTQLAQPERGAPHRRRRRDGSLVAAMATAASRRARAGATWETRARGLWPGLLARRTHGAGGQIREADQRGRWRPLPACAGAHAAHAAATCRSRFDIGTAHGIGRAPLNSSRSPMAFARGRSRCGRARNVSSRCSRSFAPCRLPPGSIGVLLACVASPSPTRPTHAITTMRARGRSPKHSGCVPRPPGRRRGHEQQPRARSGAPPARAAAS